MATTGNLTQGGFIATPNANVTPAQTAAALASGWTPTSQSGGGASFAGGSALPSQGSAAYNALSGQAGAANYNPTTGSLSINGQNVALPPVNPVLNSDRLGAVTNSVYTPQASPLTTGTSFVAGMPAPSVTPDTTTGNTSGQPAQPTSLRDSIMSLFSKNIDTLGDQSATEQGLRDKYQVDQNMQKLAQLQGTIGQRTAGY